MSYSKPLVSFVGSSSLPSQNPGPGRLVTIVRVSGVVVSNSHDGWSAEVEADVGFVAAESSSSPPHATNAPAATTTETNASTFRMATP